MVGQFNPPMESPAVNIFDEMERALIEASRIQRASCDELGLSFADAFPEEAESISHFIAAYDAAHSFEA